MVQQQFFRARLAGPRRGSQEKASKSDPELANAVSGQGRPEMGLAVAC